MATRPTYAQALVLWRHRLAAQQLRSNVTRIDRVAAASARLRDQALTARDGAPDKQEPAGTAIPTGSTTTTVSGGVRGCFTECA